MIESIVKNSIKMKQAFQDAVDFKQKKRPKGAYVFLNSKLKRAALREIASELVIGDNVKTGLIVVEGRLFKIEPIFDKCEYICEELIYLGELPNDVVWNLKPLSRDMF
jgi:hypothetical protein